MLGDQTLAEDNHVIVVNQPLVAQSGLVGLGPGSEFLLATPSDAISIEHGTAMPSEVNNFVRMVLAEKRISSLLQQPITDSLSGHRKWERYGQAGQASIRHQEMTQTEPMDRTNEKIRCLLKSQAFNSASEFASALLTISDARNATRGLDVFG